MNYNEHDQTNGFLDSVASNSFIPLILQPTRITSHSNTLTDNMFLNIIDPDIISHSFTAIISAHLPQFAINLNIWSNTSGNDLENFILGYFSVDWEDLLKIDERNADNATKTHLDKINMLLDTYAPLT